MRQRALHGRGRQREREQLAPQRRHALVAVQRLVEHDRLAGQARVAEDAPGHGRVVAVAQAVVREHVGIGQDQQPPAQRVLPFREQPSVRAGDERGEPRIAGRAKQLRAPQRRQGDRALAGLNAVAAGQRVTRRNVRVLEGPRDRGRRRQLGAIEPAGMLAVLVPLPFGQHQQGAPRRPQHLLELARARGRVHVQAWLGHDQQGLEAGAAAGVEAADHHRYVLHAHHLHERAVADGRAAVGVGLGGLDVGRLGGDQADHQPGRERRDRDRDQPDEGAPAERRVAHEARSKLSRKRR